MLPGQNYHHRGELMGWCSVHDASGYGYSSEYSERICMRQPEWMVPMQWYSFFKITLPYMLFVTTPYLITQFIGNINNFNVIYLLTKGAPAALSYNNGTAGKTDLLVTWLYKLTMDFKDYNYAAVISIAVFVLSAVFFSGGVPQVRGVEE